MKSVFKKRDLFLKESYKESEGVYTFVFEKDEGLNWKAGQHGLFTINHKKIKNPTKPFTLASAPTENIVRITMKINDHPSEFKAMLELKQGMKVTLSGPLGSFNLKNGSPSILIACGIGITPIRSIVKQIEDEVNSIDSPIHLLYLESNQSYIFKDELDKMANNPSINVTYLDSMNELYQEIEKSIGLYKDNGKYFVAGPKSMVDSIVSYLRNQDISKKNIKKDAFFGY